MPRLARRPHLSGQRCVVPGRSRGNTADNDLVSARSIPRAKEMGASEEENPLLADPSHRRRGAERDRAAQGAQRVQWMSGGLRPPGGRPKVADL